MLDTCYKQLISHGDTLFPQLGLKTFLLNLPLNNENNNTENGIRNKIYRNFSYTFQKDNNELNIYKNEDDVFNIKLDNLEAIDEVIDRTFNDKEEFSAKNKEVIEEIIDLLSDSNICGFIFLLAKPLYNKSAKVTTYKPILGAIVELIDDYERSIRMIFCKRKFPYNISDKLIRVATGRIMIHALKWKYTNGNRKNNNSKLVSILNDHIVFFPIPAYDILIKEMNMSSHWEIPGENMSHIDNSKSKCPCSKISYSKNSRQFWGISESRFINLIKTNPDIFGLKISLNNFSECVFFRKSDDIDSFDLKKKESISENCIKKRRTVD